MLALMHKFTDNLLSINQKSKIIKKKGARFRNKYKILALNKK